MTDLEITEWKAACVQASINLELAVEDMWAKDDPYEMHEMAYEAMAEGVDPSTFIHEIFEEDLARQEGDCQEQDDAMEAEFDYDNDYGDISDFDDN